MPWKRLVFSITRYRIFAGRTLGPGIIRHTGGKRNTWASGPLLIHSTGKPEAGMSAIIIATQRGYSKKNPISGWNGCRSEEHTSELPYLMSICYARFWLKKYT